MKNTPIFLIYNFNSMFENITWINHKIVFENILNFNFNNMFELILHEYTIKS